MIIGNPFMFAILVERVAEWNNREAEDNGHFAFCIKACLASEEGSDIKDQHPDAGV